MAPAGAASLARGAASRVLAPLVLAPLCLGAAADLVSWDEAHEWARGVLPLMSSAEKHSLMQGIGWAPTPWFFDLRKWWHVGNTAPLPRLGIPSLNMGDAAGGFRTYWTEQKGTVTCWPSQLSLAATWDPKAVHEFAVALGREFTAKGASGILGPSVEVHRVARNGRNFEYLSGEDPYLGKKLTEAYVHGVQSQGVFAVIKHFVFNHQETNRGKQDSVVDDKTAWELYYPPFEAAVQAGVSAFMCSYNKINGEYACSNQRVLKQHLKGEMGFRGFVLSDWWATHHTSVAAGLDQEQPGVGRKVYFGHESLLKVEQQHIDDAVGRVLAVVRRAGLVNRTLCVPPPCEDVLMRTVTGPAHVDLARRLTAASVVLLQNRGGVLPLEGGPTGVASIAIIGEAAVAEPYDPNGKGQGEGDWATGDYYSGGGSGHIVAGNRVRPLEGLKGRAAQAGIQVVESLTNNATAGAEAAERVDVAVIVAATTSGESRDRTTLHLDNGADLLIAQVAAKARRTVVLMQAPGAVLMPWKDDVASIMVMFLGGQETGGAWADVVFGDHAPAGRLPLMMPASEADTIQPTPALVIPYAEGLETSYRNKAFAAAFPFGHGLAYTTFEYEPLAAGLCTAGGNEDALLCVHTLVRNTGSRPGGTVAQLYLELSAEAGQPAALLKGFGKTELLQPGGAQEVTFELTARDLSYYSTSASGWLSAAGATAHVGESSKDIRQSLVLPSVASFTPTSTTTATVPLLV